MKQIPTIKQLKENCVDWNRVSGMDKIACYIALCFTKLFLYTPIKPMQVMFLWFIFQILSCLVIIKGGYFYVLIGFVLYQISTSLDHTDGQMARYYGKKSILALYVDQLFHWINYPLLFISLSIGIGKTWLGIAIGVIFIYGRLFVFNPSIYNFKNRNIEKMLNKISWNRKEEGKSSFTKKVYQLFQMPIFLNVLFFGILFNLTELTLYLYLILFIIDLIRRLIYTIIQFKKIDKELYG